MEEKMAVVLAGFVFVCEEYAEEKGEATVTISVSGDGQSENDLRLFALGTGDADVISCEKRLKGGAWMPAVAQKTSPELSGDVGVDGVIVNEWVGKGEEEPSVAFRLTLRSENLRRECAVACAVGGEVHIAQEKLFFGVCRELFGDQLWQTPVSQPFCLYIVVPEGYKPEGACKAGLSMLRRGMAISHEAGEYEAECERSGEALKMDARARLTGMVKVTASLPLKSRQACGDGAFAVACDCFEVDQIIGYTRGSGAFKLRDIAICPGRCHPDLTLLNARHGKSVYRLDGEMTIHCKRCPSRPLE